MTIDVSLDSLPSCSKWYPLVLISNWKSLGWIIKIRLHFIISPSAWLSESQVRCWCYTQLKADTKTGIIFLSVAFWMDIKGINQWCRTRKKNNCILWEFMMQNFNHWTLNDCVENCGASCIFLAIQLDNFIGLDFVAEIKYRKNVRGVCLCEFYLRTESWKAYFSAFLTDISRSFLTFKTSLDIERHICVYEVWIVLEIFSRQLISVTLGFVQGDSPFET